MTGREPDGAGMRVGISQLLAAMSKLDPAGEPVDQRVHALQCAAAALDVGASDEAVVAALLHDVGRVPTVARRWPGLPHEHVGALWCRERFGERVSWLVGAHVQAKRFLVATDPGYAGVLSPASVRSLRIQGGTIESGEAESLSANPWWREALALRRWDDAAKDPTVEVRGVEEAATEVALRLQVGDQLQVGERLQGDGR